VATFSESVQQQIEAIERRHRGSPFLAGPLRIIDDVEYATMEWVDWFNNRRLHSSLDYVPPEEYESAYYAQTQESQPATLQP
jgi:putative transposase